LEGKPEGDNEKKQRGNVREKIDAGKCDSWVNGNNAGLSHPKERQAVKDCAVRNVDV